MVEGLIRKLLTPWFVTETKRGREGRSCDGRKFRRKAISFVSEENLQMVLGDKR